MNSNDDLDDLFACSFLDTPEAAEFCARAPEPAVSAIRRRLAFSEATDSFPGTRIRPTAQAFPALTPQEREILRLLAAGVHIIMIARRLNLSERTVKNCVSTILHEIDAADQSEVIAKARKAGITVRL